MGPRKCFTLIPARLLEYVRYKDTPMQHEFYTIASPEKQSTFQEHNEFWQEERNISHHSLKRHKKNQHRHTEAVINFVNKSSSE